MIRILDRYIIKTVVTSALLALAVVVALEMVFDFLRETEDIGEGTYTLPKAVLYILLSAPYRAYQSFPFATLIGSLLGLGAMAARHELVVIRASGVSVAGVARSVVMGGLLLAVIAMAIGELVAPPAEKRAERLKAEAVSERLGVGDSGFWARDQRRFVEVRQAPSPDRLEGLRVYSFADDGRLIEIMEAAVADYDDGVWRLRRVVRTEFSDQGVEVFRRSSGRWESELAPQMLDVVVVEPKRLPLMDLATYIDYLERNALESERYRLAFWIKLATPLATVTMLVLTIPLVFGSQRRKGIGRQLFLGICLGLGFYLFNRLLNYVGLVYGLPAVISALGPALVFLAAGLVGIRYVR